MALQGGKVCVCAETCQNSPKRGVQSLGGVPICNSMEGQVTEIRPEPKPVKWGAHLNNMEVDKDKYDGINKTHV